MFHLGTGPGGASRVTPHGAARRLRGSTFVDSASATGTAAVFSVAVCFRRASPFLTGRTTRFFPKTQTVNTIAEVVSAVSGTQSRPYGSHGLQVSLLSTRRGPVQSENVNGVTGGDRT